MRLLHTALLLLAALAAPALAQTSPPIAVGGVVLSPEGVIQMRKAAPTPLARQKGDPGLAYVSITKALEAASASTDKPLPESLRTLGGLTRIDYLFVYPDQHDLVIAGPCEPVNAANPLQPVGKITGRPTLQLDDLVTILRAVHADRRGNGFFGCSLDLTPNAADIVRATDARWGGSSRAKLAEELKKALGPLKVRVLGVPADSRVALAMVSADYRLKRMCIGLDPVPGVGNALGSALAASRVWFEPAYAPLAVADDGLSYQFAGPRLRVEAGPQEFKKEGATPEAAAFAKRFSEKVPVAADKLPEIADLQNLADLFLVAALIKQDALAQKAGVDLSALLVPEKYTPATFPAPTTAELLVHDNGSMIAQGGVAFAARAMAETPRAADKKWNAVPLRARPAEGWLLAKTAAK